MSQPEPPSVASGVPTSPSARPSPSPPPSAFGAPAGSAQLRATAEDFVVDEWLEIEPDGAGEHLWLQLRKRGENTAWVARQLARVLGVAQRQVSYAGLKDRHAVTSQWFSVHCPPDAELEGAGQESRLAAQLPDSVEVLHMARHRRKLRRGAHRGNHFHITLREFAGDRDETERRLAAITAGGFANYFGEQRFGHDGGNLLAARRLLRGELRRVDRNRRGLYLSAARSALFNCLLAARIEDGSWRRVAAGQTLMLDGSHSTFRVDADTDAAELAALQARHDALDLHSSGALWGRGEADPGEAELLADEAELCRGLEGAGLDMARRALRAQARELRWEWCGADGLALRFTLDAGVFATSLLRELVDWRGDAGGDEQ